MRGMEKINRDLPILIMWELGIAIELQGSRCKANWGSSHTAN